MPDAFTIAHKDDFEKAGPKWCLARKSLGVASFGLNVVDIPPGEGIPEHHELDRDQEEVFVVLSGSPTMVRFALASTRTPLASLPSATVPDLVVPM